MARQFNFSCTYLIYKQYGIALGNGTWRNGLAQVIQEGRVHIIATNMWQVPEMYKLVDFGPAFTKVWNKYICPVISYPILYWDQYVIFNVSDIHYSIGDAGLLFIERGVLRWIWMKIVWIMWSFYDPRPTFLRKGHEKESQWPMVAESGAFVQTKTKSSLCLGSMLRN